MIGFPEITLTSNALGKLLVYLEQRWNELLDFSLTTMRRGRLSQVDD
jgi:hypothetical protein